MLGVMSTLATLSIIVTDSINIIHFIFFKKINIKIYFTFYITSFIFDYYSNKKFNTKQIFLLFNTIFYFFYINRYCHFFQQKHERYREMVNKQLPSVTDGTKLYFKTCLNLCFFFEKCLNLCSYKYI
jgi:hypothetical protein